MKDVDFIILDYLVNVFKDEIFDFGFEGKEVYDVVGLFFVVVELVDDEKEV